MLLIIRKKATEDEIGKVSQDLHGYIKVVLDISQNILAAGGLRHVEAEQLLLKNGSRQKDLWGGGLDLETLEIDFDSMINVRPADGNTSREVLSGDIRTQMEIIIRELLL